jgi:hypothetical protein
MAFKDSKHYNAAKNSLPEELKPVFDSIVEHYRFHSLFRCGRPYVSYIVLADMVRAGWRKTAAEVPEKSRPKEIASL